MFALVILLVGGLVAIGVWSWLAPRAGAQGEGGPPRRSGGGHRVGRGDPLGLRSPRAIAEQREALEAEDLAQMIEAHNAWRRRRGRPERTVEEVEMLVARDLGRGSAAVAAQRDLDELLEATNARRRARGLPERDLDEVRSRNDPDAAH